MKQIMRIRPNGLFLLIFVEKIFLLWVKKRSFCGKNISTLDHLWTSFGPNIDKMDHFWTTF
jgi:hypothetical protein